MIATIAGVVLGVAFLVAGGSKLAAGGTWPAQARELGAPAMVIPVVPWFELVLGGVLVVQLAPRSAAAVALAALVAFTLLIVRQLRQGRHPPCACFGAWSARPLGPGHVVRNVALMLVAVVAFL